MKYIYLSLYFLVALLLQNNSLVAQQLSLLNQDIGNLNPAFISSNYYKYDVSSTAKVHYRHQWIKLKGAPKTIIGSFSNWNDDNSLLLGGNLIHDETGPIGFTGLYAKAGYGLSLNRDMLLSIGVKGGLVQYRVKGAELRFLESGDIANDNVTKLYPDFSLGAMLYYKQHSFIGFSTPQVFGLNLQFKDDIKPYQIQRVQHYYGIIGTRFDLGDESWLEVSSESRFVQNVPFYIKANLEFEYRHLFWINTSASNSKEISIGIGVIKDMGSNNNLLRLGYTFSNFFQTYGVHFGAVHELGISISW